MIIRPTLNSSHWLGFVCTQNAAMMSLSTCQQLGQDAMSYSSLFIPTDVSKYEMKNQGVHKDYTSRLCALLELLFFNIRAKTKYYAEFVQ